MQCWQLLLAHLVLQYVEWNRQAHSQLENQSTIIINHLSKKPSHRDTMTDHGCNIGRSSNWQATKRTFFVFPSEKCVSPANLVIFLAVCRERTSSRTKDLIRMCFVTVERQPIDQNFSYRIFYGGCSTQIWSIESKHTSPLGVALYARAGRRVF